MLAADSIFLIVLPPSAQCSSFGRHNNTLTFLSDNLVFCKDVFESNANQAGNSAPAWPEQDNSKAQPRPCAMH